MVVSQHSDSVIRVCVYICIPFHILFPYLLLLLLLNCVQIFVTPWTAASQAPLSFTIPWSLLKFMSLESVMLSNHLILFCLLFSPSIFPSIRVFFSPNRLLQNIEYSYLCYTIVISSVQFSPSVVSNSLQPHEPQHARPPCPSPTPRVHPNPCPLRW